MSVYFARRGLTGPVKIGFTTDISKRIRSISTPGDRKPLLIRLIEGDRAAEKQMHQRFSDLAIGGEWFRFDRSMLGDIGATDLPIPKIGRFEEYNLPATPHNYRRLLHHELLLIAGGGREFARRCQVRPWVAIDWFIPREHYSALFIVLAERGRVDITRSMLEAADREVEIAEKERAAIRRHEEAVENEQHWLRENQGIAPWWDVFPENRDLLKPPKLTVAADNSAKSAVLTQVIPPSSGDSEPQQGATSLCQSVHQILSPGTGSAA